MILSSVRPVIVKRAAVLHIQQLSLETKLEDDLENNYEKLSEFIKLLLKKKKFFFIIFL